MRRWIKSRSVTSSVEISSLCVPNISPDAAWSKMVTNPMRYLRSENSFYLRANASQKLLLFSELPHSTSLFRYVPTLRPRPPAADVPAIRFVVSAKIPPERRFFVQDDEQMHAESNNCNSGNRQQAGVSEDNPQPDPARGKAHIHGIAHVAVEAYNY